MNIYLDFDGTVVSHQYPDIGNLNQGCFEVINKLQAAGHDIILNSYRANKKGKMLHNALAYLNNNISANIQPINKFLEKKADPGAWSLEEAKKSHYIFIDDYCFGIPLKEDETKHLVVDWLVLDKVFADNHFYDAATGKAMPAATEYFPVTMTVKNGKPANRNLFARMFKHIPISMNVKMNMNTL